MTDRQQIEPLLQGYENKFSNILNSVNAAISSFRVFKDGNWEINHISDGCTLISGYSPAELIANKNLWIECIPPEDWQAIESDFFANIFAERTGTYEYRFYHKSGDLCWFTQTTSSHWDEAQNYWFVTTITSDISNHKQAETLLELQNQCFGLIATGDPLPDVLNLLAELIELQIDHAICSILLLDDQGKLRIGAAPNFSPEYAEASDGLLIGEGVASCGTAIFRQEIVIVSDIALDPLWQDYKDFALSHNIKACWSIPIFARDSKTVLGSCVLSFPEPCQPSAYDLKIFKFSAYAAGIAIDRSLSESKIQQQLVREQELLDLLKQELYDRQQAEIELRTSENLFRFIVENIQEGIWKIDADGATTFVNQKMADMLGYTVDEIMDVSIFDFIDPESRTVAARYFDRRRQSTRIEEKIASRLQKERRRQSSKNPNDFKFRCKDGSALWAIVSANQILDISGNNIGALAAIVDITDRQKLEKIKDEFISVVSHELRTPLTAIRGALGILESGVYDNRPEKAKHMLQIAFNNSDRLVRLVNDMLDLERLESGENELAIETCQVAELMQQAVEFVCQIALQANITIEVVPLSVQIQAAPNAVVQVLVNLLGNAIKFSSEGSTVWLSAEIKR